MNCGALRAGVHRKSRLVVVSISRVLETLIYVCALRVCGRDEKCQNSEELSQFASQVDLHGLQK